jgi:O-methyltransferase involved in polyketide biosynthesis
MSAVSPTAHYTGYVWARNGLSHPELSTVEGRVLFESLRPVIRAGRLLGWSSLESYLLTRHRAIDVLLERAIERAGITQVVEVAAGLSPRGWRFMQRYSDVLTYIEADLPEMAARKRRALERMDSLNARHRVAEVDVLNEHGPDSLQALLDQLDEKRGLAIITEGLLGYLPRDAVEGIWRRFATALAGFPRGRYISDIHIGELQTIEARVFRVMLSAFVRGRVHLHFGEPQEVQAQVCEAGFKSSRVYRAARLAPETRGPGSGLAHTLEAVTA